MMNWGVTQVIKHLPSKHKAPSSNPSIRKRERERHRGEKEEGEREGGREEGRKEGSRSMAFKSWPTSIPAPSSL
jgi:hypothetical protein